MIRLDIELVIRRLNKDLGTEIPTGYYSNVKHWLNWWKGKTSFHTRTVATANGRRKRITLYSLEMAKKICEDWASLILNEKTEIAVKDTATAKWLQGDSGYMGVLGELNFWSEANRLIEKSFATGTGAFVLKIDQMAIDDDGRIIPDSGAKLRIDYLSAESIIPITVKSGVIIECAFASEVTEQGKKYVYVETHLIEDGKYVIKNHYYVNQNGSLQDAVLPIGIAEVVETGSAIPFFSIIKPNITNPISDNLGLGCSVYAQAISCLKGVDLAYNNFNQDFFLGGKKVFYDRTLGESSVGSDGKVVTYAPDEVQQSLFWQVGDNYLRRGDNGKQPVYEFNPTLRVTENVDGIQAQLNYLSFKCGLGARYYKFNSDNHSITAKEYSGEKQDVKQNAAKHSIAINEALTRIVRAILWAGKNILGASIKEDDEITIRFSDGYIVSDDERRAQALREVDSGIMQPWEYRVMFYNEDEATAKKNAVPRRGLFGDE